MGVYLNPGNDRFKRSCNSDIYVDKTKMISLTNRVIDTEQNAVCISRPRRFDFAYDSDTSSVYIPNAEILEEVKHAVEGSNWMEVIKLMKSSDQLLQATWQCNESEVAKLIDEVHSENTSILTYNDENSLSCVISLAYYNAINEYKKIRELPTGKGFADLVYIPRKYSDKPAMIIELKYDKSTNGAITQIKEKRYVESLKAYRGHLLLVGINYDRNTKKHSCKIEKYVID